MLNEALRIKGRLQLVLTDENGNVKLDKEYNNYITNAGKALIAQSIYKTSNSPVAPTNMGVGIGNSAISDATLTALQNEYTTATMTGSSGTATTAVTTATTNISGTVMTVSAMSSGTFTVGMVITGGTISGGPYYIVSFGTGSGGAGTYNLNAAPTAQTNATITGTSITLTIAASPTPVGYLSIGGTITGSGVTGGTIITGFGTGTGANAGTYFISASPSIPASTVISMTTRPAITPSNVTTQVTNDAAQFVATFGAGVATGALNEAGIFNATAAGTMICRTVFGGGASGVINKGANDTLTITWRVTVA